MNHHAFVVDDQVGGTGTDVDETNAEFALVCLQHGIGAGERLENGIVNVNARAVQRRDNVLSGGRARGDDVYAYLELASHQTRRVAHAALTVENEFLRQQVKSLAVLGHIDAARFFYRLTNVFAADLAGARTETDSAVTVDAADVRARNTHDGVLNRRLRHVLRFFHRLLDGGDRLVEIGDDAFAHAARVSDAVPAIAQSIVIYFGDDDAGLGATDVDNRKQVFCLATHVYACFFGLPGVFFGAGFAAGAALRFSCLYWRVGRLALRLGESGFTMTWWS